MYVEMKTMRYGIVNFLPIETSGRRLRVTHRIALLMRISADVGIAAEAGTIPDTETACPGLNEELSLADYFVLVVLHGNCKDERKGECNE